MARPTDKGLISKAKLIAIGDAIRGKTGGSVGLTPDQMATAIAEIKTDPILQAKSVTPSASDQTITPDSNYDGLSQVVVYGDEDLVPKNIAWNTELFGVQGDIPFNYIGENSGSKVYNYQESSSPTMLTAEGCGEAQLQIVSAAPSEWVTGTLPSSQQWLTCCGNGRFIAVKDLASVYSDDGINWTSAAVPLGRGGWNAVTYGNGKFVAVGSGYISYSFDGNTWTPATLSNDGDTFAGYSGVTYGDDKFVAVGYGTQFAYSYDGINWSLCESILPYSTWKAVAYGHGKFVAVTAEYSEMVAYSSDGITWNTSAFRGISGCYSIVYANGKFVVPVWGWPIALYSFDGITWHETNMPSQTRWESIAFGNGRFMAVSSNATIAAYSNDGITWEQISTPFNAYSITFGDNKFLIVPNSNGGTTSAYMDATVTRALKLDDSNIPSKTLKLVSGSFTGAASNTTTLTLDTNLNEVLYIAMTCSLANGLVPHIWMRASADDSWTVYGNGGIYYNSYSRYVKINSVSGGAVTYQAYYYQGTTAYALSGTWYAMGY